MSDHIIGANAISPLTDTIILREAKYSKGRVT